VLPRAAARRTEIYKELFSGELPYDPQPAEEDTSLASLARITRRSGIFVQEVRRHVDSMAHLVERVLADHELLAQSAEASPEAIFCFAGPQQQRVVAEVVTYMCRQWELTQARRGFPFIFSDPRAPSRWLIIEAAAAAATSGTPRNGFFLEISNHDRRRLAKLLAVWGPKFVDQWFDGTILRQWAQVQGMSDEVFETWRTTFGPAELRAVADKNNLDPLGALNRAKAHLEGPLSSAAIAEKVGWSIDEVALIFTPARRLLLTIVYPTGFDAALRRIKRNLEEVVTCQNLAERYGMSDHRVREVFTPSRRVAIAVACTAKPLTACDRLYRNREQHVDFKPQSDRIDRAQERLLDGLAESASRRRTAAHPMTAA
jgi:hypothetical protein